MASPLWEVIFWENTVGYLGAQSRYTFFQKNLKSKSPTKIVSLKQIAPSPPLNNPRNAPVRKLGVVKNHILFRFFSLIHSKYQLIFEY